MYIVPPNVVSTTEILDEDKEPHMRYISFFYISSPISASLGGTSAHIREVVDIALTPHVLLGLPPPSLWSTDLR